MLKRLYIDNFKSLSEFSLPADGGDLPQFVCLVGLNGSGKSTVLQALDFLSRLVAGDMSSWMSARKWENSQLVSKFSKKRTITFSMEFEDETFGTLRWAGAYNVLEGRCVSEELEIINEDSNILPTSSFKYEKGVIRDHENKKIEVTSEHSGSIFSSIRSSVLGKKGRYAPIILKYYLSGVKSLELLSPSAMRAPSRDAVDVGMGGKRLAAFINGLSKKEKSALQVELSKFYPALSKISARSSQYGWKRIFVSERFGADLEFDARHVNDGLLRIAAIVAQTVAEERLPEDVSKGGNLEDLGNPEHKAYQFVLLDEIENGINPELVSRLVKYLTQVRQQVFVTTHSPLILNFLDDDTAKKSVFLLYRKKSGASSVVRLFSLPQAGERLAVMGAGEAYLDMGLEEITSSLSGTVSL
jgi:predicted ATPase